MKPAGFSCKIDKLGRIVIPKPIRKKYDLKIDDTLEMFTEPEGIILKKYAESCIFCGNEEGLVAIHEKPVCLNCLQELKYKI